MTESKLFVSSCDRREWARRRGRSRLTVTLGRTSLSAVAVVLILLVCSVAFVAGQGGL